jgi:large subunit ribosomal protein L22
MSIKISVTSKNIRIAPNKINQVLFKIRNKTYIDALNILRTISDKKCLNIIWKTLYSVIMNAINIYKLEKSNLIISEAFVNQASILKRIQPRAKGKAFPIEKKYSHITITVAY